MDFNEFILMRKRTMRKHAAHAEKEGRRAKGGTRKRDSARRSGRGRSGSARSGGAASDDDTGAQPDVPIWVQAVREKQRKGEERYAAALIEHDAMIERRFAASDALADLSEDELLLLEQQVLPTFPSQLSAAACSSCLSMLGLRIGKMFDEADVERFVATVMPSEDGAAQKTTPAALLAGLHAGLR